MKILFIDTESSGLDPSKHGTLQIACEYWNDGKLIDTFNKKITNKECIIDLGALRCNGWSLGQIRSSHNEEHIVKDFVDFIMKMDIAKPVTVCGQGISFDVDFLKTLLARHKIEGLNSIFSHKLIDTSALALCEQEAGLIDLKGNFHLNNIAKVIGLEVDETKFHEASYDCQITRQVYFKLIELMRK